MPSSERSHQQSQKKPLAFETETQVFDDDKDHNAPIPSPDYTPPHHWIIFNQSTQKKSFYEYLISSESDKV